MEDDPLLRQGYILLAAFAGAVTALAFMKWKQMTKIEIAMTLFVGFSFAIFVTPWIAHVAFGVDESSVRTIAGITYVTASGSNTLLPMIIRGISRAFNLSAQEETK